MEVEYIPVEIPIQVIFNPIIYIGRELVEDKTVPEGYSYSGTVIPFDPANVMPLFPNTKAAMLPEGSEERRMADSFNNSYNILLNGLHITFNGTPGFLNPDCSYSDRSLGSY